MKKISAIIREDAWEKVMQELVQSGVKGASITTIKGYGEYLNSYRSDGLETHTKIDIIASENEVDRIVNIIMESAHTGLQGDGIVSVVPVEQFYRIRSKAKEVS